MDNFSFKWLWGKKKKKKVDIPFTIYKPIISQVAPNSFGWLMEREKLKFIVETRTINDMNVAILLVSPSAVQ